MAIRYIKYECYECDGSGIINFKPCEYCNGDGEIIIPEEDDSEDETY